MAISVVYTIRRKGQAKVHDIITHTDQYWLNSGSYYVTGGVRSEIEKEYPQKDYNIDIDFIVHPGNQSDA